MKKAIILILICISLDAFAPANNTLTVFKAEVINPYERIWNAICQVESNSDALAYNPLENSYGIAQIREVRLRDYNDRTGKKVSLNALFDVKTSKLVFMYFACKYSPDDYESIAKDWNKSRTDTYWNKVRKLL
jgi:hypothetical protein